MSRFRAFLVAICVALNTASPALASYSGLYIFGDSLSDPGNNALVIGTDPGQTITGNGYIPTFPYASGQYTNGNVWATSFAASLGLAPYAAPALAGGGNFAFGGARTSIDGPVSGFPFSLTTQATMFLGATGGFAPSNALYVVAGGGNDARDALAAIGSGADIGATIAATAASYATDTGLIVDALQAAGAQRIVVWNVPNLGLAPAVTSQGPGASFLGGVVASSMNVALSARMAGENGVSIFDDFSLLTAAVLDPGAFGFSNVTDACGAAVIACDPSTALFWDGIHPTAAGHALLAQQMLQAVPEPETYAMLLAGLGLLAFAARRRNLKAAPPV